MYDPAKSHFDLDLKRGAQGELFVADVSEMLAARNGTVEVKRDSLWMITKRIYVERECCGRDGVWRPSGLATTKAKLWAFVAGQHPFMLILETEWLRRAVESAAIYKANHLSMNYGQNPTRGIGVYINQIISSRVAALDEHRSREDA